MNPQENLEKSKITEGLPCEENLIETDEENLTNEHALKKVTIGIYL